MTRRAPGTGAAQAQAAADLVRDGEDFDTVWATLRQRWPDEDPLHLARIAQRAVNSSRIAA